MTLGQSLRSVFKLHNETANIYSHLAGVRPRVLADNNPTGDGTQVRTVMLHHFIKIRWSWLVESVDRQCRLRCVPATDTVGGVCGEAGALPAGVGGSGTLGAAGRAARM